MLWTIFVILLVLWLVGIVSSRTMGGFIHVLLRLAGAFDCRSRLRPRPMSGIDMHVGPS